MKGVKLTFYPTDNALVWKKLYGFLEKIVRANCKIFNDIEYITKIEFFAGGKLINETVSDLLSKTSEITIGFEIPGKEDIDVYCIKRIKETL